jgi:hypothetical protein
MSKFEVIQNPPNLKGKVAIVTGKAITSES